MTKVPAELDLKECNEKKQENNSKEKRKMPLDDGAAASRVVIIQHVRPVIRHPSLYVMSNMIDEVRIYILCDMNRISI